MFHRMSFLKGSGLAQSRPVLSHCFHSTNQLNATSYTNYCIFFCNVPLYTSQRSITYLEWVSGLVKRVDGLDRATLQQSPYLSLRACTSLLLILVTPNSSIASYFALTILFCLPSLMRLWSYDSPWCKLIARILQIGPRPVVTRA